MNVNASLSATELDQLAEFLGANGNPDALTLEGMDGLFCALVASPESVLPHQYLPVIWGGDLPGASAFGSLEEADAMMSLIMRYWNSAIADLEREGIHLPFIIEPGIDGIVGREWARGFMRGTRLAPTGWGELWQEEHEGQVLMIPIVAACEGKQTGPNYLGGLCEMHGINRANVILPSPMSRPRSIGSSLCRCTAVAVIPAITDMMAAAKDGP